MPSDRAIAHAFREHEARGFGTWVHVHASITNRAAELDAQQQPADGGQRELPVAQVRRGGMAAPNDALYVGLIPCGPLTPEVKEGDLLYLRPTAANVPSGLPELPKECAEVFAEAGAGYDWVTPGKCYYTPDQMRAYGEQCRIAAGRAVLDAVLIRQAVARGWCAPENADKPIDADLAHAISREVIAAIELQGKANG